MLLDPVVFANPADAPMKVLPDPVVMLLPDPNPISVLFVEDVPERYTLELLKCNEFELNCATPKDVSPAVELPSFI
jgi:hypothetical protein